MIKNVGAILILIVLIFSGCKIEIENNNIKCIIEPQSDGKKIDYHKVVFIDYTWKDYDKFSIRDVEISYNYGPDRFPVTEAYESMIILKNISGEIARKYEYHDPREQIYLCERGGSCPEPEFLKNGEDLLIINYISNLKSIEIFEANNPESYEDPIMNYLPPNYKLQGRKLFSVDISDCMQKFCNEASSEGDPNC